jgi:signal transduction histidine kinase
VCGDVTQIREVLMNLVINASEAITAQDGVITIKTGTMHCSAEYLSGSLSTGDLPAGSYSWFEVADTGCGMNADTQKHIFEPFFTTKFAGRGLGLSAVLGIVRGHKGALLLSSSADSGARFRVLLPAATGTPTPDPRRVTLDPSNGAGKAPATPS